jgi:nitrate/nitrite transporter NarK
MQSWVRREKRGFAQGITHACARLGNAITPPLVAWLMIMLTWRGSFVVLGCVSLIWIAVWFWFYRDDPARHRRITEGDLAVLPPYVPHGREAWPKVPWRRLTARMLPVTVTYFCYGWTLGLFLNWLPSFFLHEYNMKISGSAIFSSGVFFAGVVGDTFGGVVTDAIYRRTGDLRQARRNVIVCGFLGALVFLVPIFFTHDLATVALCLSAAFFCAELVIAPIWAIPMDIAPQFSGTAAGLMNTGSAVAAILSPLTFGFIIDLTGNWELPFIGSIGLLALGLALSFTMHPDIPFDAAPARRSGRAQALAK